MRTSFADNATGSERPRGTCTWAGGMDECGRAEFRDGLCQGHYSQRYRGRPLTDLGPRRELMPPTDRLRKAALVFSDVDAEDDRAFRRAMQNLCAAALTYASSVGWRKPKRARRAA